MHFFCSYEYSKKVCSCLRFHPNNSRDCAYNHPFHSWCCTYEMQYSSLVPFSAQEESDLASLVTGNQELHHSHLAFLHHLVFLWCACLRRRPVRGVRAYRWGIRRCLYQKPAPGSRLEFSGRLCTLCRGVWRRRRPRFCRPSPNCE